MLDSFLFYIAIGLVCVTLGDVFVTVLSHNGAGWITKTWTSYAWKLALFSKYRFGIKWLIRYIGPFLLVGVLIVWYSILYVAWFIFLYVGDFTIKGEEGAKATALDIVYYIGSTFSTLGLGDYTPNGFPWTIISTGGAFTASLLISFAISYLIPVVGAVADRRELVSCLNNLGRSAHEVLEMGWAGSSSGRMDATIVALARSLVKESYKSQVYPVIEYFYFRNTRTSTNLNVLTLFDALIYQKFHSERAENGAVSSREFLLRSINTYVDNFSKTRDYKKDGFEYSHKDFIDFLNSYQDKTREIKESDIEERVLRIRESLLNFAYHEGRLPPDESVLKQTYLLEESDDANEFKNFS